MKAIGVGLMAGFGAFYPYAKLLSLLSSVATPASSGFKGPQEQPIDTDPSLKAADALRSQLDDAKAHQGGNKGATNQEEASSGAATKAPRWLSRFLPFL